MPTLTTFNFNGYYNSRPTFVNAAANQYLYWSGTRWEIGASLGGDTLQVDSYNNDTPLPYIGDWSNPPTGYTMAEGSCE